MQPTSVAQANAIKTAWRIVGQTFPPAVLNGPNQLFEERLRRLSLIHIYGFYMDAAVTQPRREIDPLGKWRVAVVVSLR